LVWNSGDNTNQFKAWYPATASYDSFELPTDQSDASKLAAADWMTATTVDMSKPSNCELGLMFAHKLTKVTVNISETYGSQFDNSPTLNEVKIYTHDGTKTITPMAGTNSYTAIVTPGQYNGSNNFMTFNAENAAFAVKPTTTLTSGLEAGKHYTFTLTVGKDKATIGNVSVADWGIFQEITGGVAEWVNACFLPKGKDFNDAISAIPNRNNVKAIEFVADTVMVDATSFSANNMPPNAKYIIIAADGTNPKTLKICTDAEVFMFNADCSCMFQYRGNYLNKITSIKFNNCVNTENVTYMNQMFSNLTSLEKLDLSCFVTSNVINMSSMFAQCHKLTSLDIRNFNVNKVTNFTSMFYRVGNSLASGKTKIYVANPNPFADDLIDSDDGTKAVYVVDP
jgi:surface protein